MSQSVDDLRVRLALYETWGERMIHVLRKMRAKANWKGDALLLLREIETGGWRKTP